MPEPAVQVLKSENKRYKCLYGGRGSGKSTAIANYVLTKALSNKRILACREVQNSIRDSVHRLLCDRIREMKLDRFFTITQDTIKSIYGSEIIFRGLKTNPSEIKSLQGISICWVEEAEKVSEESWNILIPTIREPNSEILISFNPESEDSPVLKRFVRTEREDSISALLNFDQNDLFPEVLRKEMEYDKANDYEKYMYVWEGNPKRYGQSVIFKNKLRIEEFDEANPDETQFYFGADWGFGADPSCLVRLFIKDRTLYIDKEFYGYAIEIDDLPRCFDTVPKSRDYRILGDSSRPDTISYMSNHGFNCEGAEKGAGSVEDGIEFLKNFEAIIIHPTCTGAISDFSNYRWKVDRITGEVLPIPLDKSNHAVDAARYALEPYMKAKVTIFEGNW